MHHPGQQMFWNSKKWATRVGSKCISTVEGGQLKASSHRSRISLAKLFGHLPEGMIAEIKRAFILYYIIMFIQIIIFKLNYKFQGRRDYNLNSGSLGHMHAYP
jgi:hypothetical protein